MHVTRFKKSLLLFAIGMALGNAAYAFGFGNMMNPSRWWGGDRDDHDDYYGAPPYGYPGGYAAPGYAPPAYTAPGYTAPAYTAPGYAAPGYVMPGYAAPAYTAPPAVAPAPAAAPARTTVPETKTPPVVSSDELEIARLKERIRELEAAGETPVYTVPSDAGTTGSAGSQYPADSPYNQEYRFPDSAQGGAAPAAAVKAEPEYPVYSPFGPPAEFPPLEPDADVPAESAAVTAPVAAPPVAPTRPMAPAEQAVAVEAAPAPGLSDGVADFTPGNPAAYVPPMQNTGQRVYEFGR